MDGSPRPSVAGSGGQMNLRRQAGRRAGGGPLERVAQIKKRYPQDWDGSKPGLIYNFSARVKQLYNVRDDTDPRVRRYPFPDVLATVQPSRMDGMLPWLYREVRQASADREAAERARADQREWSRLRGLAEERFAALDPHKLKLLAQWYVAARPDLLAFTAPKAIEAAQEWQGKQADKALQQALRRAYASFKPVLKGRGGWWGVRPQHGGPPAHVLTVAKVLGFDFAHESWLRNTDEDYLIGVLFDRAGQPQVMVLYTPNRAVYEVRAAGHKQVDSDSPYAAAVVSFLRKTISRRPSAAWGEGALALKSIPMRDMLGLDESILQMWSDRGVWIDRTDPRWRREQSYGGGYWQSSSMGEAATAVRLLLEGPNDDGEIDWPETQAETSWEVERAWPKDQGGEDRPTVMDWIKPYPLAAGEAPTFVRAEMVYKGWDSVDYDMRRDVWKHLRDMNKSEVKALGKALKHAAKKQGHRTVLEAGAAEWAEEEITEAVWYFMEGYPETVRTKYWQVVSYEWEDDLYVIGSIDAGRVTRNAQTPQDVIDRVKEVLDQMKAHLEWWLGSRHHQYCQYDCEYSSAMNHALRYLILKHVTGDQAAAAAYFERHKAVPEKTLGRSNRRRRRRR